MEDSSYAQFNKNGYCFIPNVISGELLEKCKTTAASHLLKIRSALLQQKLNGNALSADFSEVVERPGGRSDIRFLEDVDPLTDTTILNSCIPTIEKILGGTGYKLCFSGLIVASPNSDAQGWHQDGPSLFNNSNLPPHCLNVLIPLCDVSSSNGATEFRIGSQHCDAETSLNQSISQPELSQGSALLFDYRVWHRGGANTTTKDRIIAYWTFSKPWFVDPSNHRSVRRLLSPTTESDVVMKSAQQTELSDCRKTLLEMEIELEDAPSAVFRLLEGDNPTTVAEELCASCCLSDEFVPALVQQALESLGSSVGLNELGNLICFN